VRSIFNIGSQTAEGNILLCEWGEGYCCYATYDSNAKKLLHLDYCNVKQADSDAIGSLLTGMKNLNTTQVLFGIVNPYFTLLPLNHSQNGQSIFQSLNPLPVSSTILEDNIHEWQIKNVYTLPAIIADQIIQVFPEANFIHFFTSALKVYNGFVADQQIAVNFVPGQFQIVVKKNGQLVLAQMYEYQTPLDVVYYLLKIVEELSLPKDEIYLILSGLIEEDSDLYRELHQYFRNIHFMNAPSNAIPDTDYPGHFFTSISNLAICVS
jgi:hypothetical protein